jgi:hypothetical protein
MRQPVIEIAAKEDHVVVGCQYDSFSMYRFDEVNAKLVFMQRWAGMLMHYQ